MDIEIVGQEQKQEIKFKDLKPGVVFEFDTGDVGKGPKALKLAGDKYVLLSYSNDNNVGNIDLGDGSMISYGVKKVYGKLVGVKVRV